MVLRIIPARAGPTGHTAHGRNGAPDHPRSCGANRTHRLGVAPSDGSSPLVRGQPRMGQLGLGTPRIIPARAGPTSWNLLSSRTTPDHPRSCGANSPATVRVAGGCGSSPLVRGQQPLPYSQSPFARIIPARAGPTSPSNAMRLVGSDHPRSCGANFYRVERLRCPDGSSPLVRGQPLLNRLTQPPLRIIPARAGPTTQCFRVCIQ